MLSGSLVKTRFFAAEPLRDEIKRIGRRRCVRVRMLYKRRGILSPKGTLKSNDFRRFRTYYPPGTAAVAQLPARSPVGHKSDPRRPCALPGYSQQ